MKAVRWDSVLSLTMSGMSSSSSRSPVSGDADQPGGVAHEEGDLLGRGGLGGHDQVALVLAVLVVDHHDDLAPADGRDGVGDGGELGGVLSHLGLLLEREQALGVLGDEIDLEVHGVTGPLAPSVVTSAVWGMTATVKPSSVGWTTVRLTPSTVIEPFSMM